MAARRESARRVSDCVTALLRDQPFFGSLALRLPIRPDAARETLASDGREIRYSPDWVANTDADLIKTAIGRVVLACALKHHTRRAEREPGRWQQASQLVTHGLLRDAGFKLPPDAEAWDGISVEQAYDRLPEPQEGERGREATARHRQAKAVAPAVRNPTRTMTIAIAMTRARTDEPQDGRRPHRRVRRQRSASRRQWRYRPRRILR